MTRSFRGTSGTCVQCTRDDSHASHAGAYLSRHLAGAGAMKGRRRTEGDASASSSSVGLARALGLRGGVSGEPSRFRDTDAAATALPPVNLNFSNVDSMTPSLAPRCVERLIDFRASVQFSQISSSRPQ